MHERRLKSDILEPISRKIELSLDHVWNYAETVIDI